MKKYSLLFLLVTLTCGLTIDAANMVVKPATVQPPLAPTPVIAPVPTPPPPPNTPPTEKGLTIINSTSFPMNIRFETNTNPGVVDTIPAHSTKRINYKINSLVMYSFEELKSQPITPNMISQDVATITTPPELLPKPPSIPSPHTITAVAPTPINQPIINSKIPSTNTALATPQLPAAASSQGPPGFKAERPR